MTDGRPPPVHGDYIMIIHGLNKVTLLDFPGRVACTVFTGGCDFRCPFCHNSQLVLDPGSAPRIPAEDFFSFLEKRRGILDGVAVTGGEPLLQQGLADFLRRVKEMGFAVKLDTNGNHPARFGELLSEGLVDYAAVDIKNCPGRYAETVGIEGFDVSGVRESASMLLSKKYGIPYEFRTTAVREFHDVGSFRGIADFIAGAERYFIQNFVDSGAVIRSGLHGFSAEELAVFADAVRDRIPSVAVRGV